MSFKELPQNVLGWIVVRATDAFCVANGERYYYVANRLTKGWSGVSLGEYRILTPGHESDNSINHEYGHSLQSQKYGWLYLINVGLVSFIRNIYDRVAHRKWSNKERIKWYYSGWPEKQADELGGVTRCL